MISRPSFTDVVAFFVLHCIQLLVQLASIKIYRRKLTSVVRNRLLKNLSLLTSILKESYRCLL